MRFTICVNKPGQLPEADPTTVEGLEATIEAVEAEIEKSRDALGEEAGAIAYFQGAYDAALLLTEAGGVVHMPDGYVIDITPEG
jgi:hypothetical protein